MRIVAQVKDVTVTLEMSPDEVRELGLENVVRLVRALVAESSKFCGS